MPSLIILDTSIGCCSRLIRHLQMLIVQLRATGQRQSTNSHDEHPLAFENANTYDRWYRS